MLSKIKEFIQEVIDTLDWILAGCPQPQKIPVKVEDGKKKATDRRDSNR